jgi:quinoprotein glucose dehydrogenase
LADITSRSSDAAIRAKILGGGEKMPAFGSMLNAEQVTSLLTYLKTRRDVALINSSAPGENEADTYLFDGLTRFLDPDGYPAVEPPWGTLSAIDISTGKYVWKIPLGEYPELAKKGLMGTGSYNWGGPIVTAGGLLFIGATAYDNKFRAFDKHTGQLLWETKLPAAGIATPSTYRVRGHQFIVIAAGGGKNPKLPSGSKIIAFSLPAH